MGKHGGTAAGDNRNGKRRGRGRPEALLVLQAHRGRPTGQRGAPSPFFQPGRVQGGGRSRGERKSGCREAAAFVLPWLAPDPPRGYDLNQMTRFCPSGSAGKAGALAACAAAAAGQL